MSAWFAANRPDYVFLVAGTVGGILANSTRPAEFIYDNLMIHGTVVHSAHETGVRKLLYLGSSCIYPRQATQPITEEQLLTGPLEQTNEWYAIAKIAGIKLCQAYRRQYGCDFISAMPTNLYGPGDNFDLTSSHVIPALMRKFHDAKVASAAGTAPNEVSVWGTGSAYREFLHVDDLASACVYLMDHYSDDSHINVGTGVDLSIKELAESIRDVVNPERPARLGHVQARRHAAQAARRVAPARTRLGAVDRAARRPRQHVPLVPRSDRHRARAARGGRRRRAGDRRLTVPTESDAETRRRIAAAWRELRRGASGAVLRAHLVGPAGPDLEQAQLDALEVLAGAPDGWRMSEFADAMHVDPSTATRAIDRLARLGLAERTVDVHDRRVVIARATEHGTRTVREMVVRRSVGMERLLEPFDTDEREQFAEYLERLVASVDRLVAELTGAGGGADLGGHTAPVVRPPRVSG